MLYLCHKCRELHYIDNIALSRIWDTKKGIKCKCGTFLPFEFKNKEKNN